MVMFLYISNVYICLCYRSLMHMAASNNYIFQCVYIYIAMCIYIYISFFIRFCFPYKPSFLTECEGFEHPLWFYGPQMTWSNICNQCKEQFLFEVSAMLCARARPLHFLVWWYTWYNVYIYIYTYKHRFLYNFVLILNLHFFRF